MKKSLLAMAAAVLFGAAANAQTWGVVGTFNDWGGTPDIEMTPDDNGNYTVTTALPAGEFKFRYNSDWTVNLGARDVSNVDGNGVYNLAQDGLNLVLPADAESITFVLDPSNNTVTVSGLSGDKPDTPDKPEPKESLYIIGQPAGEWNPAVGVEMTKVSETEYTWKGYFESESYFALATVLDPSWDVLNAHRYAPEVPDTPVVPGEAMRMVYGIDGSWKVEVGGEYTINVNLENSTFVMSDTTSVEVIETPEGDAEYYNLQGVRVANPEKGIFICVQNGKARKVAMK